MRFVNTNGLPCAFLVLFIGAALSTDTAHAAFNQRYQATQKGGFVLVGNTLAHNAAAAVPPPIVGNVGFAGSSTGDSAPDIFWQSDFPFSGAATANTTIAPANARTTANLAIPAGSTITHAQLYWSGQQTNPNADDTVTFSREGGFSATVDADVFTTLNHQIGNFYQSTADVTSFVQTAGPGTFRLQTTLQAPLVNVDEQTIYTGWSLVVAYSNPLEPTRQITIQDGLDLFNLTSGSVSYSVSRPSVGIGTAQMGFVTYEGDSSAMNADSATVNGLPLFDGLNPANDVFNSTYTRLGVSASSVGDLPQLTGTSLSMSGIDIDTFDVSAHLGNSLTLNAVYDSDEVILTGVLATALPVQDVVPEPAGVMLALLAACFVGVGRKARA
jgi:Protein of unknown function (DUF3344)